MSSGRVKEGEKGQGAKKGLRRESNPGHPHPKRVFYHLTTKPSVRVVVWCVISRSISVSVVGKDEESERSRSGERESEREEREVCVSVS